MSCPKTSLVVLQTSPARTPWIRLVRGHRRNVPWHVHLTLWHIPDDISDSDVPVSVLFLQPRPPRPKPPSGNKGKAKARTDVSDVTNMDASVEDAPLGGSHHWIRGCTVYFY